MEKFIQTLYGNIGKKIKVFSVVMGILYLLAGVITFLALVGDIEEEALYFLGGGIVLFFSTWFLYGFGVVVDRTENLKPEYFADTAPSAVPVVPAQPNALAAPTSTVSDNQWTCSCGHKNYSSSFYCANCGSHRNTPKPAAPVQPSPVHRVEQASPGETVAVTRMENGDWKCPKCGAHNKATRKRCFECGVYIE